MPKEVKQTKEAQAPNVKYLGQSRFKYSTNNGQNYVISYKFDAIIPNTITYTVKLFKSISTKKVVFIKEFSFNSSNVSDNKIQQLITQVSRKDYTNLPVDYKSFNDAIAKQILSLPQNKNANNTPFVNPVPVPPPPPTPPPPGEQITINNIIYTTFLRNNTYYEASVTGNTLTTSGSNVTIPDTIEDQYGFLYPVTAIGQNAFLNCTALSNIFIPNGVIASYGITSTFNINQSAFQGCANLVNIEMLNMASTSITTIGQSAFQGCKVLRTMTLPYSTTAIGSDAFKNCNTLQNINGGSKLFTNLASGTLFQFFSPFAGNNFFVETIIV